MIRGIGIDIVDTARMKKAVDRSAKVVNEILTDAEIAALPNSDIESERFIESLSARFAAKEAFAKSLGISMFTLGMHNIEILKNGDVPILVINPDVIESQALSNSSFHLSLTHSDASAVAVVICEQE